MGFPGAHWFTRKRLLALGGLVAALVAAALIILFVVIPARTGDVSHPAPFHAPRKRVVRDTFVWPFYGYQADRTRDLPAPASLGPPFHMRWQRVGGRALLEFPPVIDRRYLFELDDDAVLTAIDKHTGRTHWKRDLGGLAAASPAVVRNRVYAVILARQKGGQAGRVVALRQGSGRTVWSHDLPSRAESSPVVANRTVYFGSEDGTLYALRTRDGSVRWTFHAGGAIKGGPALVDGTLYFGDYSGKVYAVRASNGSQVWSTGTSGAAFGSGTFYATPAVEFGRVYLGNTDGRVYSFVASSGKLAWAKQTGAYVYGSAAVADIPRLGPTVYVGSYDGNFYALDARTGAVRWTHPAGGKISGGATLVGGVVYFANLAARQDVGLDARTGRQVFSFNDGAFNPVVSDGHTIYLIGYGSMYALAPQPPAHGAAKHGARPGHRPAATG